MRGTGINRASGSKRRALEIAARTDQTSLMAPVRQTKAANAAAASVRAAAVETRTVTRRGKGNVIGARVGPDHGLAQVTGGGRAARSAVVARSGVQAKSDAAARSGEGRRTKSHLAASGIAAAAPAASATPARRTSLMPAQPRRRRVSLNLSRRRQQTCLPASLPVRLHLLLTQPQHRACTVLSTTFQRHRRRHLLLPHPPK